jgi:hypothetical protein
VNASYDKNTAIVVLPRVLAGRLQDNALHAWLAQSDLTDEAGPKELLARVVQELGVPYPDTGFAALRMWGQTGDRPTNWIAGADPVYLEPQLDKLCLHTFADGDVTSTELRALTDHLQQSLGSDQSIGFTRLGACGYVSSRTPIATAQMPANVVDQQNPEAFLPAGDDKATHRNLIGEIEMALHEHEVNIKRESDGKQLVNSLWLWGGGVAPEQITQAQPPLFADDPLLTGYWYAATGVAEPWPGSIANCLQASVGGFVAVVPESEDNSEMLESSLEELRHALRSGRLSHLMLLFRDGLRADVQRSHALRIWRRSSPLLKAPAGE